MIVCCINCYNDWPLIQDCVRSVYSQVDRIIAVDGRYKDFPKIDSVNSTDGTLEYLNSLDKIKVILTAELNEVEKRNKYLEDLKAGDIVLNLDADELVVGNITNLISDFGIIDLHDGHCNRVQKRATRFFKYRSGMLYRNVHYTLYWKDKKINSLKMLTDPDFSFEYVRDFYLIHNWHLRSQFRIHHKRLYYQKLVKSEAGYPR
jgi:hypothetical protein